MRQRPRHPDSPLVRLLRDPGGALAHALHVCVQVLEQALPFIAATSGLLLALALALADLRRRRSQRLAAGARLVRVAVPPELDPEAAGLLWKTLHDLLRPRLARLLQGQPHLGWEISADRSGSAFRLWLPGSIPPGLVERALAAAWPGTSVTVEARVSPSGFEGWLACCELRLSGPEWRLLGGSEGADPLRLVLGQLAGLAQGEQALVQLLVRPATAREQRRLLAVARRLKAGQPARPLARLLDLLDPTPATPRRPAADPALAPEVRDVLAKAAQPLFRVALRLAVALAVADGRYHLHLLGPTGVGKSTLIARLALADLASGRGAVVVDPKGDLVEDLLARIPQGLAERVDLLDPLDPQPPGLNVLEGADHDLVVDQLVGIFRRVYERFWGPRTDDILRAGLLTLLETGSGATLADVPRLLTDAHWREQLLDELDDPVGLEPFWEWYDGLGEAVRAQTTGPVLNNL